jgi:phospholipase C
MILPEIDSTTADSNLNKIDHIVILMMENRSFDHMLGYLSLEGNRSDIDGLAAGMLNTHNNIPYPVHRLSQPRFPSNEDPCHEARCVTQQLSNNNGGFVNCFAQTFPNAPDLGFIMGYYYADALPVYDQFASDFLVCDRWFASVPGQTWPNRLYAVTGRCAGSKDNQKVPGTNIDFPIYSIPSFPRILDEKGVSWKWYSHDISTLRLIDDQYRIGHGDKFHDFTEFLNDASNGNLASVSWIDPYFAAIGGDESHDDHPPSTIQAGQILAFKIYSAICNSSAWNKTLFLVVYDEHGGLYDHVPPVNVSDDDPNFQTSGIRVPAMVVSPWVEMSAVSNVQFDHTTIIKTIFERFCKDATGNLPNIGARTAAANHLGCVLTRATPRPAPQIHYFNHLAMTLANQANDEQTSTLVSYAAGAVPPPKIINNLQQGLLKAQEELVKLGHPLGVA